MEIINVVQGTPEWHALRADPEVCTASEAPVIMCESKHTTRDELLKIKATRIRPEVDSFKQSIFDKGHAVEALARPLVENILGETLYPSTCTAIVEGIRMLASLDGLTMDETIVWENKLLNELLVIDVQTNDLAPHYYWQLEQQLLVTGAKKAYFTTSDGTPAGTHGCWYRSVPERRTRLIAGWKQFLIDLANYQHVEVVAPAVGATVDRLPALVVTLVGNVISSNLVVYKERALKLVESINTNLQTDQDFADAETMVKFCDSAEKELDLVKSQALAQTATIDDLFRSIDALKAAMAAKRLALDKLVKARKESIKTEIVGEALAGLIAHCNTLNKELGRALMPTIHADFQGAIKGKRTVATLRSAASNELSRAKVEANMTAKRIAKNIATPEITEYPFLFNDLAAICTKPAEDFQAAVRIRVSDHLAAEEARIERERETIRAEEVAKLEAEAAAKVVVEPPQPLFAIEEQRTNTEVLDSGYVVPAVGRMVGIGRLVLPETPSARPSDEQIVLCLCYTYGATRETVLGWLRDMDLAAVAA